MILPWCQFHASFCLIGNACSLDHVKTIALNFLSEGEAEQAMEKIVEWTYAIIIVTWNDLNQCLMLPNFLSHRGFHSNTKVFRVARLSAAALEKYQADPKFIESSTEILKCQFLAWKRWSNCFNVLSKAKKATTTFPMFFLQEQRDQNVSKRSRTITKPFQIALWRPMTELDSDPFLQELIQSLPQCSTLEEWRRCHIKQRWENSHKQCRIQKSRSKGRGWSRKSDDRSWVPLASTNLVVLLDLIWWAWQYSP